MKHIYFTVTNDLSYDQRMHRICSSLSNAGFRITLVGRRLKTSVPLQERNYQQKRLGCVFQKGFLFYCEYNLRLLFFLLAKKADAICAIDLDTILPCLAVSTLKNVRRIYDAHEYFTELKEVRTRQFVKKFWFTVERFAVPKFDLGYTVTDGLAKEFELRYNRDYPVIRNLPLLQTGPLNNNREKFIVYQGAVNEGRGFEVLIPAMKQVDCKLIICGDGNFMKKLKDLIRNNEVGDKIELKGMLLPPELRLYALQATLGIGLAEREGINQYHALPNKFLEYMHASLPQIAMNFPEYQKINNRYKVAVLLDDLSVDGVAAAINATISNETLLTEMTAAALKAKEIYCWQNEEKKLIQFYENIFS